VGFRQAAYTTRLTRSSMLDEMNKEYVDTARSVGLSERKVIFKYTLRNAMIPTITISGLQLANLLGGTVVLETIFAWPGIGRAIYEAIIQRDYPLIQAGVLVLGVIVVTMNLLVDMTYRLLNPRSTQLEAGHDDGNPGRQARGTRSGPRPGDRQPPERWRTALGNACTSCARAAPRRSARSCCGAAVRRLHRHAVDHHLH
jgi:ABC-type Fe3+ transport system permease subunit